MTLRELVRTLNWNEIGWVNVQTPDIEFSFNDGVILGVGVGQPEDYYEMRVMSFELVPEDEDDDEFFNVNVRVQ